MPTSVEGVFLGLAREQFGLIIGIGVGSALAAALEPQVVAIRQAEFDGDPLVAVDPLTAAAIVAEAVELLDWGRAEAQKHGINNDRFDAVVGEVLNAPGAGELLRMARRGTITPSDFLHGLRKSKLETRWDDPMVELQTERLDPSVIATAIQRGIMTDPGFLPVGPPSGTGKVEAFPVSPLDPLKEAKAHGIDEARLFIETAIVGLPASVQQAASAYFRGIGTLDDYYRAVAEGNTRNEWRDLILEQARQIPTAHTFVEGRLRGWLTDAEMNAGTARWGMSPEDTHLEFLVNGRPLTWHQVFVGIRRGGVFDGPTDAIEPAFLKALQESNIRPEWYNIAWHLRFSYPTGFMIKGAVTSGDLTPRQGNDILYELGWDQKWIDIFVRAWSGGATATGKALTKAELLTEYEGGYITENELRDHLAALGYAGPALDLEVHLGDARRIRSWRDKAITALGKRYVASTMDATAADTYLQEIGVPDPATRASIIRIWDIEREFK